MPERPSRRVGIAPGDVPAGPEPFIRNLSGCLFTKAAPIATEPSIGAEQAHIATIDGNGIPTLVKIWRARSRPRSGGRRATSGRSGRSCSSPRGIRWTSAPVNLLDLNGARQRPSCSPHPYGDGARTPSQRLAPVRDVPVGWTWCLAALRKPPQVRTGRTGPSAAVRKPLCTRICRPQRSGSGSGSASALPQGCRRRDGLRRPPCSGADGTSRRQTAICSM